MVKSLQSVSALLLGSAILLFAGGLNGMILPVRGGLEGFGAIALGLLGTGWAIGYVAGCLATPRLVAGIGHIRAFTLMSALAGMAVLLSLLLIHPAAWVVLRALSGFCFAGAAMIVESWLNERTEARLRGKVFGIYTMVGLAATTTGQMALTFAPIEGHVLFVLAGAFYCLSLVPVALTTSGAPQPLVVVRLDLAGLWRNSPVAVFAAFMLGISNSSFFTLHVVYAEQVGLGLTVVALFAAVPVMAGALSQIPVGILSDRMDRRIVLLGLCLMAVAADAAFIFLAPHGQWTNLIVVALFGATSLAIYPVAMAHANDHAAPGAFIQTSGGILMVLGVGSIFGPLLAGVLMNALGPQALFYTTIVSHCATAAFTIVRMMTARAVPQAQKGAFHVTQPGRISTPEMAVLIEDASTRSPADESKAYVQEGRPILQAA
ncbi:MFS transporter [uncultured Jannaschia sp.]|uniref:MFS transporter n=1 Tax=uncultured Jannaschia sp. TaxID=293347 RepID=UPI00261B17C7|nr:MFS transporter [uncultured Jannaschia sp.]